MIYGYGPYSMQPDVVENLHSIVLKHLQYTFQRSVLRRIGDAVWVDEVVHGSICGAAYIEGRSSAAYRGSLGVAELALQIRKVTLLAMESHTSM